MTFPSLRAYIQYLEKKGDLLRIRTEVDPYLEITCIQHRVMAEEGPALLFENVKGSPYTIASNLFGSDSRVESILGKPAKEIGQELLSLSEDLMPPSLGALWENRKLLYSVANARLKTVTSTPLQDTGDVSLGRLPVLTCWPEDGGPFFTLPLIHTIDPESGKGNLGIYRMQVFDETSTGMHWQIEKGGGFHYSIAEKQNAPLPLSVTLGGPPALTIAAIAPLPEGIDERLLASYLMGEPLDVIKRPNGHRVASQAEFILEGVVEPLARKLEGPFGDHLGHYSHSSLFPVFSVQSILAREDAIYPATVVGKPPQEDLYIGNALQEMFIPLLKIVHKGITDLWTYPETGFHPLAVAAVKERYTHEGLKHACAILGQGQLSLTKTLCILSEGKNTRDFTIVSEEMWRNLDTDGVFLLAPTAQDTLDFTGPDINLGSRLILLATEKSTGPVRTNEPPELPDSLSHPGITGVSRIGPSILVVQTDTSKKKDCEKTKDLIQFLHNTRPWSDYLFHVLVSYDVDIHDTMSTLWGWFTRFDPLEDVHPAKRTIEKNRLKFSFPLTIDSRWKEGYRKPVEFRDETIKLVDKKWIDYGLA